MIVSSASAGYSVVPDFLCQEALEAGKIKLVWEGSEPWENTLYFGTRKNSLHKQGLEQLKTLFKEKWQCANEHRAASQNP